MLWNAHIRSCALRRCKGIACRYGVIVLAVEILSVLSLIFYGIWLCAKTNNDDMKVRVAVALQVLLQGCDTCDAQQ